MTSLSVNLKLLVVTIEGTIGIVVLVMACVVDVELQDGQVNPKQKETTSIGSSDVLEAHPAT